MAAAGAAADGLFRCGVYEGCLSGSDVGKERRPYHRNCGCALHNRSDSKGSKKNKQQQPQQHCTHGGQKCKSVSYPLRRAWSEGNLGLASSAHSSPSSSPSAAAHAVRLQPQPVHNRFGSFDQLGSLYELEEEEEEEEDIVFFKV